MKKIVFTLFASSAVASQGHAALPPLYETASEIKWILSDKELGQTFPSGAVITEIKKNDAGYLIVTNKGQAQVDVKYLPQERPGPADYTLEFHKLEEAKN